MRRIRPHLSYANVISTLCLFLLLSGGTAVALTGSNTVQSDDLGPGAQVQAADVAANAVDGPDVTDNSITGSDVNEGRLDATPLRTRAAQGDCQATVAGTGVMVAVGPTCIDKYEASVWSSPTGGTQYGTTGDDYPCNDNGQNCTNIYARSVPGVTPSRFITYFQAQQALANSGKRLPTSAEWQAAVAGTPDSNACNVSTGAVQNTGANAGCVSNFGANDMVGNVWEWVGDWDEEADGCVTNTFGSDATCFGDAGPPTRVPAMLTRGGHFGAGTRAGPFAADGGVQGRVSRQGQGFRGAR
jgi:Sulfatase-modifying factor enzyme 1